ncbi:MAG: hypothetical protein ABSB35_18955 [Bryobacteraceae bacterium]
MKKLQKSGFDMKKVSIVGTDYHTDGHVVGYYNTGDLTVGDRRQRCRTKRRAEEA